MTPSSRILIVFALLGILLLPVEAFANENTGTGSEMTGSGEILTDTGALLEMQRLEAEKWAGYRERTAGFWATMMNNRKAATAYREQQAGRRQKRMEKRIACKEDVRRANRDAINSVTFNCYRAMLTIDLEMLRKQKQFIEEVAGPTDATRAPALFHTSNLMDAISTVVQAMDAGVYGDSEGLMEAKKNLGLSYRANERLAMTRLRVDRAVTWVTHLMIRMDNIRSGFTPPPEAVIAKIDDTISCLEERKLRLEALLPLEDNSDLIELFRQVQSDLKFCTDLALEARSLNTEIEQAEEENEES